MVTRGRDSQKYADPSKHAGTPEAKGSKRQPMLAFEPKQIIPCLLHIVLGIGRKMLRLLVNEATGHEKLEKELLDVLENRMHIVLNRNTKLPLAKRVKKSRLSRTDYYSLFQHHAALMDVLEKYTYGDAASQRHAQLVRPVWKHLIELLALASSEDQITNGFWLCEARTFGNEFLNVYDANAVTPYLHVLIYHVGYYRERYGSLERLSNLGIEGQHARNKKTVRRRTNGYAKRKRGVTYQQLVASKLREQGRGSHISGEEKEKKKKRACKRRLDVEESWKEHKRPLLDKYRSLTPIEEHPEPKEKEKEKDPERVEQH